MPGRPLTRQSKVILAELESDPEWWEGALDRLACGDSPKEVADEYCVLFGVFMRWVEASVDRKREYDAALRIAAEGHAHDALSIADEQNAVEKPGGGTYDPDVARDKLRIETRLKLAGKWDRARYGEQKEVGGGGAPTINFVFVGADPGQVQRVDVTPSRPALEHDSPPVLTIAAAPDVSGAVTPGAGSSPVVPHPAPAAVRSEHLL